MSCNRINANLTASLNSNLATASLQALFLNQVNGKITNEALFLSTATSSIQASLTSSLQASYHGLLSYIDTESYYHTYELIAELSSSLDMCYFNPPLT